MEKFNFTLFDLSGRIISKTKVDALHGMNRLLLNSDHFINDGMYFYRLEGSENSYSGKLYRIR
jgi:hypothetical protein